MRRLVYRGADDLDRLQSFTAEQIDRHGRAGRPHPGEIPHWIYNGLRRDDPTELVYIWENDHGGVAGWVLFDPRGAGLDVHISAEARNEGFERELFVWAEDRLLQLMRWRDSKATVIETDAFEDDVERTSMLLRLGWVVQNDEIIMLTRLSLGSIPEPTLPPGYRLRTAVGVQEAGAIAELHAAGFGSSWTPELYQRVMESPGYSPDREILVEDAAGELAAFCVVWPDQLNKTGLFEPVAVHPDHRRLGLGSAIVRAGMAAMASWGMEWAEVMYETENAGSGPLYRNQGFEPILKTVLYRKPISL